MDCLKLFVLLYFMCTCILYMCIYNTCMCVYLMHTHMDVMCRYVKCTHLYVCLYEILNYQQVELLEEILHSLGLFLDILSKENINSF
jgi:hypothetical protein